MTTHLYSTPRQSRTMRRLGLMMIPAAVLATALSSCSGSGPSSSRATVTDTRPIGNGLKLIGYALLGGSVVVVLGRMIK